MGNQIVNFNPSYKLWVQHRSSLHAVQDKHPASTKLIPQNQPIKNHHQQLHSEKNIPQQKIVSQKQIPTKLANKEPSQSDSNIKIQPTKAQVTRSKIPSVITGSNIATMSEQMQKGNSIIANDFKSKNSLKIIQTVGNKPGSSRESHHQEIQTILVKDRNRSASQEKKVMFTSKLDRADTMKAQVKSARARIDQIAGSYQKEYVWMLKQIEMQKTNGLKDKQKAYFLIKQSMDYQKLIIGLRTKRQILVRILNDLNQHKINESMQGVIDDVNRYTDNVQQIFFKIDWRAIINETKYNRLRYAEICTIASTDPEVLKKYKEFEEEIKPKKPSTAQISQIRKSNVSNLSSSPIINKLKQGNKIPIKDNRMSHQIMIDDIEKMIQGQPPKDAFLKPLDKQTEKLINQNIPLLIPRPQQQISQDTFPNSMPIHKQEIKMVQKQKLK